MTRTLFKNEVLLMPDKLLKIFELFASANKEIYLVGGGVRAILEGREPLDCDLTTNATPEETQKICAEFETFYENEFGMVGVVVEGDEVYEITTYRTENVYSDFRRPDKVSWGKTIEEDIVRRDFTMNAVVIGPHFAKASRGKPEFQLIDLVGGLDDFEKGVVRTVGDPRERFGEDALRMMRAIRFAAKLEFKIETRTLAGIKDKADLLENISWERKNQELMKILGSSHSADGVRMLINTGLMKHIIPEILEGAGVEQKGRHTLDVLTHMIESLENCPSSDPLIRLATLLHDVGKPTTRRLICGKCRWVLKEKDKNENGLLTCPRCGGETDERSLTTFYGHEVVGARMVKVIGERLRLTNRQTEKLVTLVRWHMFTYQKEMTDAAIRRLIRNVGKENINDLILLRIGDRKGGGSKTTSWRLQELQKRIGEQLYEPMEIRDLAVDGSDVMNILQINPGPKIGKVLKALFEEVIEDVSLNNREYLLGRIKEVGKE
jgi:tRNA nucleotidyltransferase (CCA-adding enzyme)